MKHIRLLGAATAGALIILSGCSAPTVAPARSSAPAAPAGGSSASSNTQAPAVGDLDKTALLKSIADASAAVKTSTTTMDMSMTMSGKPVTSKWVMETDQSTKGHLKAKIAMNVTGLDMNVVMDGDTYYVQMMGQWFKMDKADLEKQGTKMPDTTDPGVVLGQLESQVQTIQLVGDETVDGVPTKHYKLVMDAAAYKDLSGGQVAPGDLKTIPYDVWVGDDKLIHKYAIKMTVEGSDVSMTGVISKYNQPVSIEIPANAQALPKG